MLSLHEVNDLLVDPIRILAHHEVADAFYALQRGVREELRDAVRPGERRDTIAVAPEDEGGRLDGEVARRLDAAAENGAIPIEAAPQRARLRECLDVRL